MSARASRSAPSAQAVRSAARPAEALAGQPVGQRQSVGKTLLVGRVGEASEIARAYLFLIQEGYSTGQTVVVDGGRVLA